MERQDRSRQRLSSLTDLETQVHSYRHKPVAEINSYVRARLLSMVPWPFRRWVWWAALNLIGEQRCHNFGTFGITTVAGMLNNFPW